MVQSILGNVANKVRFAIPAAPLAGRHYPTASLNVASPGDNIAADGFAVAVSLLIAA
jgi:hypothetical protein